MRQSQSFTPAPAATLLSDGGTCGVLLWQCTNSELMLPVNANNSDGRQQLLSAAKISLVGLNCSSGALEI